MQRNGIMKARQTVFLAMVALFVLNGCATTVHDAVHQPLSADTGAISPPGRIAIMPAKVAILEISAGGSTEEVPQWSREGCRLVDSRVKKQLAMRSGIRLVKPPALSAQDQRLLEQHRALYEQVAANRLRIKKIPAWKSKIDHPDDSIGPGLAPLKKKLGADAVLFVSGYDYCASRGRVAAFIVAAVFGAIVPMGHSVVHVGLVDLETGSVLWTDTVYSDAFSLKNEAEAAVMVDQAFANFPRTADPGGARALVR
jgi:hypothetical protein